MAVPLIVPAEAAVAASGGRIRFTAQTLGARAADSPLPSMTELERRAAANSPEIRAHEAMIAAQTARVELSSKAALPDFDLMVGYGQRSIDEMSFAWVTLTYLDQDDFDQRVATRRAQK